MISFSNNHSDVSELFFVSTKEAAKIVPYTREYIGRLAREKKIPAILTGRKWLVDPDALKDFYAITKIEEEVISERLRNERFFEQQIADFFRTEQSDDTATGIRSRIIPHSVAFFVTTVCAFFLFFSVTLFENVNHLAQVSKFNQVIIPAQQAPELVEMTAPLENFSNGILLFTKDNPSTPIDPALFFSDKVEVVEGSEGVNYIRMIDGESVSEFPFIHIPREQTSYVENTQIGISTEN